MSSPHRRKARCGGGGCAAGGVKGGVEAEVRCMLDVVRPLGHRIDSPESPRATTFAQVQETARIVCDICTSLPQIHFCTHFRTGS